MGRMAYRFLKRPGKVQAEQIIGLYRAEGWWDDGGRAQGRTLSKIVSGSHCFVVAVDGGEIVGMGRAISDGVSDAYVQDVTVRDSHRGMGIGEKIVEKIVGRLRGDGIRWIVLVASRESSRLYRKLGFRKMTCCDIPMMLRDA